MLEKDVGGTYSCELVDSSGILDAHFCVAGLSVDYENRDRNVYIGVMLHGLEDVETANSIISTFPQIDWNTPGADALESARIVHGELCSVQSHETNFSESSGKEELSSKFSMRLVWDNDAGEIYISISGADFETYRRVSEDIIFRICNELKRLGVVGDR